MKSLTGPEIRESYLSWFAERGHERYPSDSLIPSNDPTLLFTGAGMNQFKDMFLGRGTLPYKRVTTSQKCLRVPDLENVGLTAGHHTFFEMLGNFSFGDYFKSECLQWVFGWFTEGLGIPRDRLVVTIYRDDDEALAVWRDELGMPAERIYRFGEKENFWPAEAPSKGPNGPCGPCSEIYFDYEPEAPLPADDGLEELPKRFIEIGNCVFTQFDRQADGSLPGLPQKNIDVGLGLERITMVLQGKRSNFDTDLFAPYLEFTARLAGKTYGSDAQTDVHLRRIADHIRAVTFCIADGALPGNEGRGYVVRKILRRACRDGYELGIDQPFLHELAGVVIEHMRGAYPELVDAHKQIAALLVQEEQAFRQIYVRGAERFESWFQRLGARDSWATLDVEERGALPVPPESGTVAFELHDTFGFPADITRQLLLDRGLAMNDAEFETAMEAQRERARAGSSLSGDVFADSITTRLNARKVPATTFTGYEQLTGEASILALALGDQEVETLDAGSELSGVELVVDTTPAYAESGGQTGDVGEILGPNGRAHFVDVKKRGGFFFHVVQSIEGRLARGDVVEIRVDEAARRATERHHTATHLLHQALKDIVGPHVGQAGSLVTPTRLRFDFTHGEKLSSETIAKLEQTVTREILAATPVEPREMGLDEARSAGFVAMFGEKYGDVVRTLSVGDYSRELCGGTHVANTGNIGAFRILSESSVAAGVRRIEAVTGFEALRCAQDDTRVLASLAHALKAKSSELIGRVASLQGDLKKLRGDLDKARRSSAGDALGELEGQAQEARGGKVLAAIVEEAGTEQLLDLLDRLRKKAGSFGGILFGTSKKGVAVVASVTKDMIEDGLEAGHLVKTATGYLGGGGGGRPEMAQGRGRDATRVDEALEAAWQALRGT